MAFEKFLARRGPIVKSFNGKFVTIHKSGKIVFSKMFSDEIKLKNNQYIFIFYDKGLRKVALQILDNKQFNANKISYISHEKMFSFSGWGFLKYYKIDYDIKKSFDIAYDEELKLFVFDLNKPLQ